MTLASTNVLGSCSIVVADSTVTGAPSNLFRLSAFIALSGHRLSASRQRLGTLLWPDISHAKAAANLRQSLLRIRHFQADHGFTLLQSNGSTVSLDTSLPLGFDLLTLLNRLADPAPDAAIDICTLYAGDLLADLPDSGSEFEEWLALQRDELRNRCVTRLDAAMAAEGGLTDAARMVCAQKLITLDPCNEDAYCWLIRHAAAHGQRSRILALFDSCQRQLRRDLGVEPSAQTWHVFNQSIAQSTFLPM